MSFTFIKEIDETLEETVTVAESLSILVDGNTESIHILSETATEVLAKAKAALEKGEQLPADAVPLIAAFRMLSNKDQRAAIASAQEKGKPSIRKLLKFAGKSDVANKELANLVKHHGQRVLKTTISDVESAATDENAKKQLILKIGKMMDIMGRIQTSSEPTPGTAEQEKKTVSSWFK